MEGKLLFLYKYNKVFFRDYLNMVLNMVLILISVV